MESTHEVANDSALKVKQWLQAVIQGDAFFELEPEEAGDDFKETLLSALATLEPQEQLQLLEKKEFCDFLTTQGIDRRLLEVMKGMVTNTLTSAA